MPRHIDDDSSDDSFESVTPRPVDIGEQLWREMSKKVDDAARWISATDQDLYGHRDQRGRLARLEETVKRNAQTIDSLKGLTWKIVTAAALAGTTTSIIIAALKWAMTK